MSPPHLCSVKTSPRGTPALDRHDAPHRETLAAPWRVELSRRAFLQSTSAVPALLASASIAAPVPVPLIKPGRGEPWDDGTFWDDGTGWVA